jgi:hypothetical protein
MDEPHYTSAASRSAAHKKNEQSPAHRDQMTQVNLISLKFIFVFFEIFLITEFTNTVLLVSADSDPSSASLFTTLHSSGAKRNL